MNNLVNQSIKKKKNGTRAQVLLTTRHTHISKPIYFVFMLLVLSKRTHLGNTLPMNRWPCSHRSAPSHGANGMPNVVRNILSLRSGPHSICPFCLNDLCGHFNRTQFRRVRSVSTKASTRHPKTCGVSTWWRLRDSKNWR